jgi:hypothetical protein
MKILYVLIDASNSKHYGYTFDMDRAFKEAKMIEDNIGAKIDVYEFYPEEEF